MNFSEKIIDWYRNNKRDLPWRNTKDPYKIWISEIILQQTRIDQGLAYYLRFIGKYPSITELAKAKEEEVLKLWQGLGYYTRARNLYETARRITEEYVGVFPDNYKDLLKLKGIGEYTAAAIASISFNEPYPVIDGNVLRFLSRLSGFDKPVNTTSGTKKIRELAEQLIDNNRPGDFNQAVMEFGALYCKPQNADCPSCIFRKDCQAFIMGKVNTIPVKNKQDVPRKRYFNYLVIINKSSDDIGIFLKKRTGNDIWKNLYDFPLIESTGELSVKKFREKLIGDNNLTDEIKIMRKPVKYRHILSHQVIHAQFLVITNLAKNNLKKLSSINPEPLVFATQEEFSVFPLPRLIEKYFNENEIF